MNTGVSLSLIFLLFVNRLNNEIGSLEVGILYNNVGVSYEHAEVLQDVPEDRIEALIEVFMYVVYVYICT